MEAIALRVNMAISGVKRQELANRIGVDQSTVWRYERGQLRVPEGRVPEIMAALYGTGDVPRRKTAT